MIYHMLPVATWQQQLAEEPYRPASLAAEGFIHCTGELSLLLWVANRFYRAEPGDFVILCIDEAKVQVPLQWDLADGHRFPHLYGPLNLSAVVGLLAFPRTPAGEFLPPDSAAITPFDHEQQGTQHPPDA